MMEEKKCCGTCKHHWKHLEYGMEDPHEGDWWCSEEQSEAYGAFTGYGDICEEWEAKK